MRLRFWNHDRLHIDPLFSTCFIAMGSSPMVAISVSLLFHDFPRAPLWGMVVGLAGFFISMAMIFWLGWYRGGPLHWLARSGQYEFMPQQIAQGSRVTRRNGQGQTPMYLALDNQHVGCVLALLAAGASRDEAFWASARDRLSAEALAEVRRQVKEGQSCPAE